MQVQIWEASKHYKKLPYTFIYLIAFFLLADVSSLHLCEARLTIQYCLRLGPQHYGDACVYLPERQVQLFIPAKYVSWIGPGNHIHYQVRANIIFHCTLAQSMCYTVRSGSGIFRSTGKFGQNAWLDFTLFFQHSNVLIKIL